MVFYNRGISYGYQGQYERTIQDFDEAIRLNPRLAESYHNRDVTYQRLGQQELAAHDFAKAMEVEDEWEALRSVPGSLLCLGF